MKSSFLDNDMKFIQGTLFCCLCSSRCNYVVLLLSNTEMLFLNNDSTISVYNNPLEWDAFDSWSAVSVITGESKPLSEILMDEAI